MKNALIIIGLSLLLASCTNTSTTNTNKSATQTGVVATGIIQTGAMSNADIVATTGSIVKFDYTLHLDSENGKVEDTSIQSVAEANGLVQTGRTSYEPLETTIGAGQIVIGLERQLIGLKKGDHRMIQVTPQEGYGRIITVKKEQIAPEYEVVEPRSTFGKRISNTFNRADMLPQIQEKLNTLKVGDTLTGADNGTIAKIIALDATTVTLETDNTANPLGGKELKVGLSASIPANQNTKGADIKITKIDGDNITLSIVNKNSPFTGKKFAVGESFVDMYSGQKIYITNIGADTVSLIADHPLKDRTLYFDIKVTDVKDAHTTTPTIPVTPVP